jgi:hypothetical protein
VTVFASFCSLAVPGSGNKPFTLFSRHTLTLESGVVSLLLAVEVEEKAEQAKDFT